jgi:hypothetical protein
MNFLTLPAFWPYKYDVKLFPFGIYKGLPNHSP